MEAEVKNKFCIWLAKYEKKDFLAPLTYFLINYGYFFTKNIRL